MIRKCLIKITILSLIMIPAAMFVRASEEHLPSFGSFPQRQTGKSVGQDILNRAVEETGAANTVTSVIWDYRGYDTLGEATVLFAAVAGVCVLLKAGSKS